MRREQIGIIEHLGFANCVDHLCRGWLGARSEAHRRAKKSEFYRKSIGNGFLMRVPSATWNLRGDP